MEIPEQSDNREIESERLSTNSLEQRRFYLYLEKEERADTTVCSLFYFATVTTVTTVATVARHTRTGQGIGGRWLVIGHRWLVARL